jgi:hypothetical protein
VDEAVFVGIQDGEHGAPPTPEAKDNGCTFGKIEDHNIGAAYLPASATGSNSAATVTIGALCSFPINIETIPAPPVNDISRQCESTK